MKSLKNIVSSSEPQATEANIRMALKSPKGMETIWIIVEAEDDVNLYSKFTNPNSTLVKPSKDESGKGGRKNVECIVKNIKSDIPAVHIAGIIDADYERYEDVLYNHSDNIFLTDQRDLEMMLLKSDSVRKSLIEWCNIFEDALSVCKPICRHFGYMRIYNHINGLGCTFHKKLHTKNFWDNTTHSLKPDWKEASTTRFLELTQGSCTEESLEHFIQEKGLEEDSFYDICRGHDLIPLLSLALIRVHIYSEETIMNKMIIAYSLDDFKRTKLYQSIQEWQENEEITVLVA